MVGTMSKFKQSLTYPWALTGIFGGIHLVITLIPYNISIGGGEISFGLVSAPIVGFLLGPFYGVLAIIMGSLIALFFNPLIAILGPFTILATAAGAFSAGAMRTKDRTAIPILFLIAMGVYLTSPIGLAFPFYIWFHLIAFIISLFFIMPKFSTILLNPLKLDIDSRRSRRFASIWLFSLVAVTLDQAVGSAIGGWYFILIGSQFDLILGFYELVVFLYAFERIVGSVLVALIIFALAEILSKVDYGLPLAEAGEYDLLELQEEIQ